VDPGELDRHIVELYRRPTHSVSLLALKPAHTTKTEEVPQ